MSAWITTSQWAMPSVAFLAGAGLAVVLTLAWRRRGSRSKLGGALCALLVSAAAALISWDALIAVAIACKIRAELAPAYAVAVDGLLGVAVFAAGLLRARERGYALVVIGFTALVSLLSNAVHSQAEQGVLALPWWAAIAASSVPAVSWALALHLVHLMWRADEELPASAAQAPAAAVSEALADTAAAGHERAMAGRSRAPVAATPNPRSRAGSETSGERSRERFRTGRGRRSQRPTAADVLALVGDAREHLLAELGREPSHEEVAALTSARGHRLSASRTRAYLAELRTPERAQAAPANGRRSMPLPPPGGVRLIEVGERSGTGDEAPGAGKEVPA